MKKKSSKPSVNSTLTLHDEVLVVEEGGDAHQQTDKKNTLTTQVGTPIADDQNSLRIGERGPILMEDFIFREKMFHFDHERIPERVVHARGYGAHGYFEAYDSLANITKANPFCKKGQKTPVFVRFSTVAGNKGSVDLARDVRGFAVKFYTEEGNWDLVGNNIPVFFIQDPIKFPDLIHAAKDEPDRAFPQAQTAHDNFWDFISLTPESMHMVMWIMSDRTIPRSFRFMEGFGVHTFRLINEKGVSTFVKFHWKPKFGVQSVLWDEAVKINGADPDYHRRDLWNAIEKGQFPEWELGFQLFDESFAEQFPFDVLDSTKLIPEELVPVQLVGKLVLNQRVDNFFAETEQVAFCTQNIIPGIDFTNDPLLQGRNFSYLDTQLKRLGGPNFTHLPINAPKCPFANFQQDGHMASINPKGRANYNPNSWHLGPRENPITGFNSYQERLEGNKLRARPEKFADHYSQAKQFYKSQNAIEQGHIADALVFELSKVEKVAIRERMVAHLLNIDEDLAKKVAHHLGIEKMPIACDTAALVVDLKPSDKLSILKNKPTSIAGRKIGIVVSDGVDSKLLKKLLYSLEQAQIDFTIISPKIGGVVLNDASKMPAQEKLGGAPSCLFDAVVLFADGEDSLVFKNAKTHEFLNDAYLHNKYIAYIPSAAPLIKASAFIKKLDDGFHELSTQNSIDEFLNKCKNLRFWPRNKQWEI